MSPACVSSCTDDDAKAPVRRTYVNLNKWPESDVEFVRSVSSSKLLEQHTHSPRAVDSISCRQMYLRSYTFSREKESVPEKTKKRLGRLRDRLVLINHSRIVNNIKQIRSSTSKHSSVVLRKVREVSCAALLSAKEMQRSAVLRKVKEVSCAALLSAKHMRRCVVLRKVKEVSCAALFSIYGRLLYCASKVDRVHCHRGYYSD